MTSTVSGECEICRSRMVRALAWVYRCSSCGFLVSTLEPSAGTSEAGLDAMRRENFTALLRKLEKAGLPSNARLLDIGCSTGTFLELAGAHGFDGHGIEPVAAAAETAKRKGLSIENGFFPRDLTQRVPFDLIVFNDVFEHLPNPSTVIRDIEPLLRPGGYLVLNLPSSDGVLFHLAKALHRLGLHSPYERLWQKGFASPHLSYFNPKNLRMLVERHTSLELWDEFTLHSVFRAGLFVRIRSSNSGPFGIFLFIALWCISFLLPLLSPDNTVAVFRISEK